MGVIYKIQHKESGKIYIGQTIRSIKERMSEHCRQNITYIDRAITKYGIDAFKITVIDYDDDIDLLNSKEQFWIAFYDCIVPNGYNLTSGGKNYIPSEYTINKLRESHIGIKQSEETKRKRSESMKGDKHPFYGKHHSNKTKQKISNSKKGTLTGDNSPFSKPIICIDTNKYYISITEAEKDTNVCKPNICKVLKGERKTAGGYHWRYATEEEIKLKKSLARAVDEKGA